MKVKYLLVVTMLLIGNVMFAQESTFTRGQGFLVRPEMYGGFLLNVGYQFNPYFQVTVGAGVTIDPSTIAQAGVRVYTNKGNWAGMIDYHYCRGNYRGTNSYGTYSNRITAHRLVGGASFKDLDFGGGIQLVTLGSQIGIGPAITVGYNIRFYKHK